jgi:DNA (cytosine-5)-methyltransferase 1
LIFVGGVGNNLWLENGKYYSRNYKQGYRVYDSYGIAGALTANGGGLGGPSGLYLIRTRKDKPKC